MDGKTEEESARLSRRHALRELNQGSHAEPSKSLDSSLKRHTALIRRMKLSIGVENRDQILKDVIGLSLEKYVDELAGAAVEGVGRCKTEKDVWSATEVISAFHRRFPASFTPSVISGLASQLAPTPKAQLANLTPELREKEDSARIARQRPVLRVCSELALVGIIRDGPGRSGGEWIMKSMKELLSNDPTLSSLPLLSTFLKSYSRPFLGIAPPSPKQAPENVEPGTLSAGVAATDGSFPALAKEDEELVEKEVRDRFKKMCEGYFDNVSKKLVIEHKKLQEQDRRNHEAYIRSGEIFEDRQQAYEKMTKGYERLLSSCQTLSELLYMTMPNLPAASSKADSIGIGIGAGGSGAEGEEIIFTTGGKWEGEEERKFYEDVQDLRDFVPKAVLGLDEGDKGASNESSANQSSTKAEEEKKKQNLEQEMKKVEAELEGLLINGDVPPASSTVENGHDAAEDDAPTPTAVTPKDLTPTSSPQLAPQGPSQMLTALLARLPECTNRGSIDQAAVDFTFLNSKAARKRLVRFLGQTPKNRTDLLPHYSRLVATLNRYMPDIGSELVSLLDEEFRYLQRKKNVVKELAEVRMKNILFISNLVKFRVVPIHVILHMFKVCLDDFSGSNVENIAMLLEGCGRFLLRSDDTRERFGKMVELMRKKQSLQHFDQRQLLLLENAYYQCNPPEQGPREEKIRTPMELFIRHLIHDVLSKKTIDKVLKLVRKLDWENESVTRTLHKVFTKPWQIKYSSVNLLAMLTYDLQRYHPEFTIGVVDQVLEDVRRGLEQNLYKMNQRRVATLKLIGELYIYRLFSSSLIFDILWSLVTFGHPEGHPMPLEPCPIDMPDDFFRVRLVCVLLDTCGMCFDSGSQKKKLDNFLTFFQYYVKCKEDLPMDVDFMLHDSLEAVRPQLVLHKTIAEAAQAVDAMFTAAYGDTAAPADDDSGGESDPEAERTHAEEEEDGDDDDEEEDIPDDRSASPEPVVHVAPQEFLGPSEDEDSEFARELAKMTTDTSAESRKVDKKTALAMWDNSVLPPAARKRRADVEEENAEEETDQSQKMVFTLVTKRGNKQQTRTLAVPSEAPLAVQTRSAQLHDKEEQQHLKRLVLDYEQREEAEDRRALENQGRYGAVKFKFVG